MVPASIEGEQEFLFQHKIDAYRGGLYVGSVGDIRYKDYQIFLKQDGKQVANERRRLFHLRNPKDSFKNRLVKLLLWT